MQRIWVSRLTGALAAGSVMLAGCVGQGILIQPVTTSQRLVETVLMRDAWYAQDKIAVIDVSGVLTNTRRARLFGEGEHPVSLLLEQLDKARRDDAVKAVILRINSPGGTVTASELMHAEITHFRQQSGKPVITLMMDLAASGGYYVACACDEIVAHHTTVTGSIGVIMQMFDVSGTMELVGIRGDAITSGLHKDTGSPFRRMRPEERELFQAIVDDFYEGFIAAVVQGRPNLDEAAVRKLADGRVFTAHQALEVGLIDRIANFRETIAATKKRIGAKNVRVVIYRRPLDYRPNYYARPPALPAGDINLINLNMPDLLGTSTPRFMYLWQPGL